MKLHSLTAKRSTLIVLSLVAVIATVEAQKPTNNVPQNLNAPMGGGSVFLTGFTGLTGLGDPIGWQGLDNPVNLVNPVQTIPVQTTVLDVDIARGYALVEEDDNAAAIDVPMNAVTIGNWHIHGARSSIGNNRLDLAPWSFPLGTNRAAFSSFWYFVEGKLRPTPRDAAREICAVGAPMLAVPGESCLWLAAGDDDSRTVIWDNFFLNGDTNAPVTAQIRLWPTGDFATQSNNLRRVYARINPDDWDGDGLANAIDPAPTTCDGDFYGTANALPTNANPAAYYWLDVSATGALGVATIRVTCDGPSDLGDHVIVARTNEVCHVPLLAGATYAVESDLPIETSVVSSEYAEIATNDARHLTVSLPLAFSFAPSPDDEGLCILTTSPIDVGAVLTNLVDGCCSPSLETNGFRWACASSCMCDGFAHDLTAQVSYEGATLSVDFSSPCPCQAFNAEHPERWFSLACPPLLMKNGNSHTIAGAFHPPCETNATLTLSCRAGQERLAVLASNDWSQVVQGIAASAAIGDVVFELQLELDGCLYAQTQTLTVAEVAALHLTSPVAGASDLPPPFPGETACPFSVTNSPLPDRHLVIPFCNVADTNDFSATGFAVDLRLELNPAVTNVAGTADWTILDNTTASGQLAAVHGLAAQFVNPVRGGIVRFRASYDGSPATEANLVLPLAGASVDGVMAADLAAADAAVARLDATTGPFTRQWPFWGLAHFYSFGGGDYRGRVDAAARPTVWVYNQVDDAGYGAIATWHGVPLHTAKLGDFLVGYACERLGVWRLSQWLSQLLGTANDDAATASWDAGVAVAQGADFAAQTAALATNAWPSADFKTRRLWPNAAPADNHRPGTTFNGTDRHPDFIFLSPGFLTEEGDDTP